MNKEIKFYFTESDELKDKFLSFVRINDKDGSVSELQIWSGPMKTNSLRFV
jgi:hypothetical protein